jgi:hypothetical protein
MKKELPTTAEQDEDEDQDALEQPRPGSGERRSRRRRKMHRMRARATRGKRLVLFSLTLAILFYGAYAFFTLAAASAAGPLMEQAGHLAIVGVLAATACWLAVGAYRGSGAYRQLYLLLNMIGALAAIVWIGVRLVFGWIEWWIALEAAGVAIALFLCWVFFCSAAVESFFKEQEFHVKRT